MVLVGPPGASTTVGPSAEPGWRAGVVLAVVVATFTPLTLRAIRRVPGEAWVLAPGAALLSTAALGALHGTAWGFDGLYSDAGFRTEAVTRFAASPDLADYAYRGLSAYYPPMLPWLQGRSADLLGLQGWQVMKPTQIAVCLLIAPLAWLLWRRVLSSVLAAWVAVAVAVLSANPAKPDEWLVLCLVVPWWLEVCRGLRRPEVPRWGAARHGLVLGALLLCHTFFFAPLAVATVLGVLVDLARRRPVTPHVGTGLRIAAVGLVVAVPTWWHVVVARVADLPSDDLQRRWSPPGFDVPPHPLPLDPRGIVEAVAVVWLLVALRRSKVAAELTLVVLTAYVFMVGGQLLQPRGLAVLPEKASELIEAGFAAAGVLGLRAGWLAWRRWRGPSPRLRRIALVALTVVGVLAAGQSLHRGVLGPAQASQSMRYPDGSFPAGGPSPLNPRWHPWGVAPGSAGPSVQAVERAWRRLSGSRLSSDDVVLSARADLTAMVPVHAFITWKSIYSHPNGEFARRLRSLRALADCSGPACAHRVLTGRTFGPVDGLVLNTDADGPYITVAVDTFPDGWRKERISLPRRLFRAPYFRTSDTSGALVVATQRAHG